MSATLLEIRDAVIDPLLSVTRALDYSVWGALRGSDTLPTCLAAALEILAKDKGISLSEIHQAFSQARKDWDMNTYPTTTEQRPGEKTPERELWDMTKTYQMALGK